MLVRQDGFLVSTNNRWTLKSNRDGSCLRVIRKDAAEQVHFVLGDVQFTLETNKRIEVKDEKSERVLAS